MVNEEKKVEYECINCSWNGTERSKSCKTLGSIENKVTKDSNGIKVDVHKLNKEGVRKCEGCGYLDNKCPVCGDETGEPGIREEIRKEKEEKEKAEREAINSGHQGGFIL